MANYETLSEAINALEHRGYTHNFQVKSKENTTDGVTPLTPEEFKIDEIHRFEGMNDPGDSDILYAISSRHSNVRGLLVNAYGAYSDTDTNKLINQLIASH